MQQKSVNEKILKIIPFVVGIISGLFASIFILSGKSIFEVYLYLGLLLASIVVGVIVHELGHLVFGLATGFEISSFRIFNLLWVKTEDADVDQEHAMVRPRVKLTISPMPMGFMLGQCLMYRDQARSTEAMPYFWYNAGGVIFNLATALISLPLALYGEGALKVGGYSLVLMNILLAGNNGIPISNQQLITNDGNTIRLCAKHPEEILGLYNMLNINRQIIAGLEPKDLVFEQSAPLETANILSLYGHLITLDILMGERNFEAAKAHAHALLNNPNIKAIYKDMVQTERLYIELVTSKDPQVIASFDTKALFKYPMCSAKRTEYAYGLYAGYDQKKLKKIEKLHNHILKAMPEKGAKPSAKRLFDDLFVPQESHTEVLVHEKALP